MHRPARVQYDLQPPLRHLPQRRPTRPRRHTQDVHQRLCGQRIPGAARHRPIWGLLLGLHCDDPEQRLQRRSQPLGLRTISAEQRLGELLHALRRDVRRDRDHTGGANVRGRHHVERLVVVAGQDVVSVAAHLPGPGHILQIPRGLLHRADVRILRIEQCQILGQQLRARSAGNDVGDHTHLGKRLRDRRYVLPPDLQRTRAIVVRIHQKRGARAAVCRVFRARHRLRGGVAPGPRDARTSPAGSLADLLRNRVVLLPGKCGALACGPYGEDPADPARDLKLHESLQTFVVHLTILERCD